MERNHLEAVEEVVQKSIHLSKEDWDMGEQSPDFKSCFRLTGTVDISDAWVSRKVKPMNES